MCEYIDIEIVKIMFVIVDINRNYKIGGPSIILVFHELIFSSIEQKR